MVTELKCVTHPCYTMAVHTGLPLRWPVIYSRFSPLGGRVTHDKVGTLCGGGGGQRWEGWDADDGGGHHLMTLVGDGMMLGVVFVIVAV